MPRAKWMSDTDFAAFERCISKVKDKGVNKYAVCMAAIKRRKHKRDSGYSKKAIKRLGK